MGYSRGRPLEDPNLNPAGGCPVHTTSFLQIPQEGPGRGGAVSPGRSRPRWGS